MSEGEKRMRGVLIFVEEVVVINPPTGAGVVHIWPHTLATLRTCLFSLCRIIFLDLSCPKTI